MNKKYKLNKNQKNLMESFGFIATEDVFSNPLDLIYWKKDFICLHLEKTKTYLPAEIINIIIRAAIREGGERYREKLPSIHALYNISFKDDPKEIRVAIAREAKKYIKKRKDEN